MKRLHRIQEWLADRVSWVQYPNIRPADPTTKAASRSGLRFKTAMPIGQRIDLAMLSFLLLMAGIVSAVFVGLYFYALL